MEEENLLLNYLLKQLVFPTFKSLVTPVKETKSS